ncbi:MAG: asparagine synthase (glutamine-hydrolyzing) [Lachnospiraceae bacterium]
MCAISGFCNFDAAYTKQQEFYLTILETMNRVLKRRGPDEDGTFLCNHCGMAHTRLSIQDLARGQQPMTRSYNGKTATISFNGEIYNAPALRKELSAEGAQFSTHSDTEVILQGYLLHGADYVKQLNGIFAFAIWDDAKQTFFLFRDRLGVKPLFYTYLADHTLLYASELKGIFTFPNVKPVLDTDGLCEIFALGPAKTYGKGVFKDVYEVLPGHFLTLHDNHLNDHCYWKLESHPHTDSYEKTIEETAWLLEDAVQMQMLSDIPICTFLSGGVDSSLVTAICAKKLREKGKELHTFSFDFTGNDTYFQANSFQPSQDRPFVEKMVDFCHSIHHFLTCDNEAQFTNLFRAVDARDLPCMADVESSMLYFCSEVAKTHKVTLTGECADEIFGGYPWFHKPEAFHTAAFPWSQDMSARQMLLSEDFLRELPMDAYARAAYERTIQETPLLSSDTPTEKRRREISYLNLKWFMVTLLDRMDRTSMYSGLEARVPFADHRIVEYVWNVPWNMKCHNGVVKSLLRHAASGKLPDEVLWRKKSPYPKTYHPAYERMLADAMREVLSDSNAPIRPFLDTKKVQKFLDAPKDYGRPWYGQLMAGPQMIAYLLQINYWLKKYQITII